MPYASSVPAAIDGLVAAFKGWPDLGVSGVAVRDGPEITAAGTAMEAVAVGYTGGENEDVVTGAASPHGLGGQRDRESYAVMCMAQVRDSGGDIKAARARAYQLVAFMGQAVKADFTLRRAVLRASLGIGSLRQEQTAGGALATVLVPVNCEAFTA